MVTVVAEVQSLLVPKGKFGYDRSAVSVGSKRRVTSYKRDVTDVTGYRQRSSYCDFEE